MWLAPWFGGLDSRYVDALKVAEPGWTVRLITTSAGLTSLGRDAVVLEPRLRTWRWVLPTLRLLLGRRARVGLLDDTWDPRFLVLWLLKAQCRVLVVHDAEPHDAVNRHRWRWQRTLKKWTRGKSAMMICFSEHVAVQLRERHPRTPVRVVRLLPELPVEHLDGQHADLLNFCVLGRMSAYKNVSMALGGWAALTEERPDLPASIRLVIAGHGAAETTKDSSIPARVDVLDRNLSESELAALIRSSVAVVVCYSSGSQSGLVSLANAFGRPVIVSRLPGLLEYQPSKELVADTASELCAAMYLAWQRNQHFSAAAAAFAQRELEPVAVAGALAAELRSAELCA